MEGQDKEDDATLKTSMMRDFINKADQIPEEIQADDALFQQAQEQIAASVIAGQQAKGNKNIPVSHIQMLMTDPKGNTKYFDEVYGNGAAARILGK